MSAPPPVPPRPADLRHDSGDSHYDPNIVSPRPHRTDNPAAKLDDLAPPPTFAFPAPFQGGGGNVPMSAPAGGPGTDWSPWNFSAAPRSPFPNPPPAPPTPAMPAHRPSPAPSSSNSLTAALPSLPTLLEALPSITAPSLDPALKITWARDVFFLADRAHHLHIALTTPVGQAVPSVSDPIVGPMPLSALEPEIVQLITAAVPLVLSIAAPFPPGQPYQQNTQHMEACQAEAVYMRAVLASTGAHPQHVAFNPKAAFRDFESAARGGYAGAWFRLGRDYETFGDFKHAKECFERGAKLGVESCLYRLGMAHLLGQLTLPANTSLALPILQRAAILASLECPQPAYVYSLLLLSEFASIPPIPAQTFASLSAISAYPPPPAHPAQPLTPLIPLGSSPHLESRHHLERAAYLHYGPAQYKLGHAYEFADPPFFFDPLLSVQYYSLASQNGEVEADMALSKWFLCGSTGARTDPSTGGFEKDEGLALTFAQKASARNLASAHFAMGYYAEVGVGRPASVPDAIHYYTLAAQAGNADANQRLEVLNSSNVQPKLLDKGAHEQRLERTRTMAQRRTEEQPMSPPYQGQTFPSMREQQRQASAGASSLMPPSASGPAGRNGAQRDPRAVVELVRKSSMAPAYLPLQSVANNFNQNAPGSATTPQQSQYAYQQQPAPQSARPSSGHGNGGGRWSAQGGVPQRPPSAGAGRQSVYGAVPARPPSAGAGRQSVYGSPQRPPSAGAGVGSASARPTLEQMRASAGYSTPPIQTAGQAGQQGGQQGGGGRRPQSPGRRQSPGPGRMGKLSVGVDSVPPVPPVPSGVGVGTPGLSAPPNTAFAGHTPRPTKGAATFAEMGIQGAKAEDKECVVM